tara:strand:+ start:3399 stop:3686 length:288 start_codon:yes stop_codon:yes gene_type:complete
MKHIYDWLDEPPKDEGEKQAKEWLNKFSLPAHKKWEEEIKNYLNNNEISVDWEGVTYICSGCSRMGDVWLKSKTSKSFYDHRVDVNKLSNWRKTK